MQVLALVALVLAPSAAMYALVRLPEGLELAARLVQRCRPEPPRPVGLPIQRLAADLHRISAHLDGLVEAGPVPGRFMRVRATTTAYDQTLLLACLALEIEPAGSAAPMSTQQRLQTEAMLAGAGLRW